MHTISAKIYLSLNNYIENNNKLHNDFYTSYYIEIIIIFNICFNQKKYKITTKIKRTKEINN